MSETGRTDLGSTVEVQSLTPADYDALQACEETVAVYPLGCVPTLVVDGPDGKPWLNGLLTCDVMSVGHGTAQWGLLLNRLGKIQASLIIVQEQQRLLLALMWGDLKTVEQELEARLIMEDAELVAADEPWFWNLLLGPEARAAADTLPSAPSGALELMSGSAILGVTSGAQALASPSLSNAAWTWLRVRQGLPWGGIDFGGSERPHEASLDRKAVSWSKGCYLGQEVVCMQDLRGKVKRTIQPLSAVPPPKLSSLPPTVSSDIRSSEGVVIGRVTSAVYDPRDGTWSILASLPKLSTTSTPVWSPVAGQSWPVRPLPER